MTMADSARQPAEQHRDAAVHASFTSCRAVVSSVWYGALPIVGLMPFYALTRAHMEQAISGKDAG